MKNLVTWFEIPATDFSRAVKFYEQLFGLKLKTCEYENEKMAFFPEEDFYNSGMISLAKNFNPSQDGVVIYFNANDKIDHLISQTKNAGGKILKDKCKIEAEGRGHFALIKDSEGNRIGFYSNNWDSF